MKTAEVSFKSIALVRGNKNQLEQIDNAIYQKTLNKLGIQPQFSYERIYHRGIGENEDKIILLTTEQDSKSLTRYFNAQKKIIKNFKPQNTTKTEPHRQLLNAIINFYNANIEKYLTIPQTIYKAESILKAIKNDTFDFKNLEIKRHLHLV